MKMKEENNNFPIKFWPIFLVATMATLVDSIQLLADEIVVGNLFDDVAFGAINLIEPYKLLVTFAAYLICVGGAALIVRAEGAGDSEEMKRLYNHCVSCCLIIGFLFSAAYFLLEVPMTNLVAGGSDAYPYVRKVFYWERFRVFFDPLYVFLFTYILYVHSKLVSFLTMLAEVLINTSLSFYLGRIMGIGGVSCATFIANVISVLVFCVYIFIKYRGIKYRPYVNPGYVKRIFPIGLPESSVFLAFTIMEGGINAIALNKYSIQGVAVVSVLINIFQILVYISEGVSEYETVAVNWSLGKKSIESLKYGMNTTLRAVFLESLFFSLLLLFGAPMIVEGFDFDDETTKTLAIFATRGMAVSTFAIITNRVTAIFRQYTGKIGSAILLWIFGVGLSPLLTALLLSNISLQALGLGIALGPVITLVCQWAFFSKPDPKAYVSLQRMTVVLGDEGSD